LWGGDDFNNDGDNMARRVDWVFGIDPGKAGGFAVGGTTLRDIRGYKMPIVGGEIDIAPIAKAIRETSSDPKKVLVIIEKVHAMPGQGVSSTFSFGCGYGKLIGMCQALNVAFDLVLPNAWKKVVLAGTTKDKQAAIDYVNRIHTEVDLVPQGCRKPHDGIADAVCLVEWGFKQL
jgi:crossover junction endodeoxyribonuclease RuvC